MPSERFAGADLPMRGGGEPINTTAAHRSYQSSPVPPLPSTTSAPCHVPGLQQTGSPYLSNSQHMYHAARDLQQQQLQQQQQPAAHSSSQSALSHSNSISTFLSCLSDEVASGGATDATGNTSAINCFTASNTSTKLNDTTHLPAYTCPVTSQNITDAFGLKYLPHTAFSLQQQQLQMLQQQQRQQRQQEQRQQQQRQQRQQQQRLHLYEQSELDHQLMISNLTSKLQQQQQLPQNIVLPQQEKAAAALVSSHHRVVGESVLASDYSAGGSQRKDANLVQDLKIAAKRNLTEDSNRANTSSSKTAADHVNRFPTASETKPIPDWSLLVSQNSQQNFNITEKKAPPLYEEVAPNLSNNGNANDLTKKAEAPQCITKKTEGVLLESKEIRHPVASEVAGQSFINVRKENVLCGSKADTTDEMNSSNDEPALPLETTLYEGEHYNTSTDTPSDQQEVIRMLPEECNSRSKTYNCSLCTFACRKQVDLINHVAIHPNEKPFQCNQCDYKGSKYHYLRNHLLTHTQREMLDCSSCDYKTYQRGALRVHMRRHNTEKRYGCPQCTYRSHFKGNIKLHFRTHTGEKPYSCTICDFRCTQSGSLKIHMRGHSGEKPFACESCDYRSKHKGNLVMHRRKHTGEKPHKCSMCNYKAAQKLALAKHLKMVHGIDPPISYKQSNQTLSGEGDKGDQGTEQPPSDAAGLNDVSSTLSNCDSSSKIVNNERIEEVEIFKEELEMDEKQTDWNEDMYDIDEEKESESDLESEVEEESVGSEPQIAGALEQKALAPAQPMLAEYQEGEHAQNLALNTAREEWH
uniref:Zinc finger protein 32-like n=1 Tax=Hirondellea gigas TaxID=1518452 RepID=A0A6A7G890_9CRUS